MSNRWAQDIEVTRPDEACLHILRQKGRYVAFLGAGASAEADVPTANEICRQIRTDLAKARRRTQTEDDWAREQLAWDDPERRYSTCLRKNGGADERVDYFRKLLRGKRPAFAHHALALLMSHEHLNATCLTTNFDKLIETAFAQQGQFECQAIRTDAEGRFWQPARERFYIVKLHGDYDTYNVRNTADETISITEPMRGIAMQVAQAGGWLVLGLAGNESSVQGLFQQIRQNARVQNFLPLGIYWGVYLPGAEQPDAEDEQIRDLIAEQMYHGQVSRRMVETLVALGTEGIRVTFFPVWGAGHFLWRLVNATGSRSAIGTAARYLDHPMRLRYTLAKVGLPDDAIGVHLDSLQRQREKINQRRERLQGSGRPYSVWKATNPAMTPDIQIVYGDITSRSLMSDAEFANARSAVVSSEDTSVSAGGGVALSLLSKAGSHIILNELSKLAPIEQGEVVVTSGGNLPAAYILHAAAMRIAADGTNHISVADIARTMEAVLSLADSLKVVVLWVPLIGTGTGDVKPSESLAAILRTAASKPASLKIQMAIVIYDEGDISRDAARDCLRLNLPHTYSTDPVRSSDFGQEGLSGNNDTN